MHIYVQCFNFLFLLFHETYTNIISTVLLFYRSIPILRQISFQEGKLIFEKMNKIAMLKVWATLEARQFINASVHDVHQLVKSDGLAPNY